MTLDASGNVAGRQAHLPFGEDFAESGTQDKHHLTSYERDSESGVDYAINRAYAPSVGRFMRPDPLQKSCDRGNPQKWNRYSYISNNPINGTDRLGLDPLLGSNDGWAYWSKVFNVLFAALAGAFELGRHGELLDGGEDNSDGGGEGAKIFAVSQMCFRFWSFSGNGRVQYRIIPGCSAKVTCHKEFLDNIKYEGPTLLVQQGFAKVFGKTLCLPVVNHVGATCDISACGDI
jgi:RHS repeat-associated protein